METLPLTPLNLWVQEYQLDLEHRLHHGRQVDLEHLGVQDYQYVQVYPDGQELHHHDEDFLALVDDMISMHLESLQNIFSE